MWLLQESNPFLDDLIQALVLTKGTGKYASAICSVDGKLIVDSHSLVSVMIHYHTLVMRG